MVTTDHPERFQSVEDALAYAQQRLQHAKLVELLWEGERAGTWAPT